MSSKKETTVKLDDRELIVKKLPIGKIAELLNSVTNLPKHLEGMGSLDNATILAKLPSLIANALPDIIEIIVIATELKKEEVEQLGADEVSRIIVAIIEVNNFQEVFDNLGKVVARPAQVGRNLKS